MLSFSFADALRDVREDERVEAYAFLFCAFDKPGVILRQVFERHRTVPTSSMSTHVLGSSVSSETFTEPPSDMYDM